MGRRKEGDIVMAHIVIYNSDMSKIMWDLTVGKNSNIIINENEQGKFKKEVDDNTIIDYNVNYGNGYLELVTEEEFLARLYYDDNHYELTPRRIIRKRIWGNMPYTVVYEGDK